MPKFAKANKTLSLFFLKKLKHSFLKFYYQHYRKAIKQAPNDKRVNELKQILFSFHQAPQSNEFDCNLQVLPNA